MDIRYGDFKKSSWAKGRMGVFVVRWFQKDSQDSFYRGLWTNENIFPSIYTIKNKEVKRAMKDYVSFNRRLE
jgi:hypothetical protein